MLRPLILTLGLLAGPALADCGGLSLTDQFSADQSARLDAAVAATPYGQGIAWTATRGGDQITLIGTFHLPDPRHDALVERFTPVLADADLLLVEATAEDEAALQQAVLDDPSIMFITDGPTLPEMLDEATWDALSDAMRERGIAPVIGSRFQPWFLMVSLGIPPCAMGQLTSGEPGLDKLLMFQAGALRVPVAALEPWNTLFDLMASESQDTQLDLLRTSLMDASVQEAMFVAMADGYFAGDVAEIWEMGRIAMEFVPGLSAEEGAAFYAEAEELLLNQRNRNWIPVIEQAAAAHDRIVVAAGAAHMPGDMGVLNLLAQNGWTISPLP
jgi:uncharacterized protein